MQVAAVALVLCTHPHDVKQLLSKDMAFAAQIHGPHLRALGRIRRVPVRTEASPVQAAARRLWFKARFGMGSLVRMIPRFRTTCLGVDVCKA